MSKPHGVWEMTLWPDGGTLIVRAGSPDGFTFEDLDILRRAQAATPENTFTIILLPYEGKPAEFRFRWFMTERRGEAPESLGWL